MFAPINQIGLLINQIGSYVMAILLFIAVLIAVLWFFEWRRWSATPEAVAETETAAGNRAARRKKS